MVAPSSYLLTYRITVTNEFKKGAANNLTRLNFLIMHKIAARISLILNDCYLLYARYDEDFTKTTAASLIN